MSEQPVWTEELEVDPWVIVAIVVVAVFILIAFGTKAISRLSVRTDGQSGEFSAEAPKHKRSRFKMRKSNSIRSQHKVRNADVDIDDSDFTDSSTDIR